MKIVNYNSWKNISIDIISRKRFSKIPEERIWYQEWRYVYVGIINMLANYLNKKDKKWDEEIKDIDDITTEQLIAHMKKRMIDLGFNTAEKRAEIVMDECSKLRK